MAGAAVACAAADLVSIRLVNDAATFRHESFLLKLPFHSGLHKGFGMHFEDAPGASRTVGWESFDLGGYLGFGDDPLPGDLSSTTLLFSVAPGEALHPLRPIQQAWPQVLRWQRRVQHGRLARLRYSRPVLAVQDLWRGRSLREPVTVVQAIRLAPRPETYDETWRWTQLDKALEHLNELLSGVMSVSRNLELSTVGKRDLPPLVFGFGWDLRPGGERSEISWEIYLPHDRLADAGSELTMEEETLAAWIATTPQDPFRQGREFLLAAWSSAQRGRFVHATVEAGTAVEVLVSASLRVAGPLLGYDANKLANVLEGAFASRLKDHFAVLFGYSRDPATATDTLGRWWQNGYALRNDVVHRGVRPTEPQTVSALETAEALYADLGDRWSKHTSLPPLLGVPDHIIAAADEAGRGPVPRYFET